MNKTQLIENIQQRRTFLCIGLDADIQKLPAHLHSQSDDPLFTFNKAIIDHTADHCIAYKPNLAFYESQGSNGIRSLERTIDYIKKEYPDHFVIADAKRGDIGNTAECYARSFFQTLNADAVTLSPYMGEDSIKPFLNHPGHWAIILALTSNKGSNDFQMMPTGDGKLFEAVLRKTKEWGSDENTMYVVGATQAESLSGIRKIVPDHFLLVPGIGAQGGSLAQVAKYGMNRHCGLLVNSSRAIIYASTGKDFAEAARKAARETQQEMAYHLEQA